MLAVKKNRDFLGGFLNTMINCLKKAGQPLFFFSSIGGFLLRNGLKLFVQTILFFVPNIRRLSLLFRLLLLLQVEVSKTEIRIESFDIKNSKVCTFKFSSGDILAQQKSLFLHILTLEVDKVF